MQHSDRSPQSVSSHQVATIAAILGAIVVNALSNFFPLNGLSIGEISNTLFGGVLVTPANYAFAIWGVIYLGLIAFGIYQVAPAQRNNPRLQEVRSPIIAASLLQILWVFAFQGRLFWLSVVVMIGILLSLVSAFLQLRTEDDRLSRTEKWLIQIPISVYFGWITVATVVNVASALYNSGWNGGGISPAIWTVVLSAISAAIAAAITIRYRDVAFPAVIIWALVAIAIRQASQSAILITAIGLAIGLGLLILWVQFRPRKAT
ncbi:tryptophan-rich sensory protein [Phormidesmis priestleyi ULC007]|uniref:Tryptophan-rich sensory protein n=1 Tax=Phormidesmis priestleyi ULC007 TaxID=1920490 RepID=A0A2T1D8T4_9CYAN|nr:tryptophan-rich sensory protein [Phormidesmis priestleyi]PSB16915.1 tryptophan-rich sensory protein [Phormidesmis priestleyi ULC007]PZO47840.1 MAG: tryptophan-rich sensory protein [Phormidesmis priestleyi]